MQSFRKAITHTTWLNKHNPLMDLGSVCMYKATVCVNNSFVKSGAGVNGRVDEE